MIQCHILTAVERLVRSQELETRSMCFVFFSTAALGHDYDYVQLM